MSACAIPPVQLRGVPNRIRHRSVASNPETVQPTNGCAMYSALLKRNEENAASVVRARPGA